MSESVRISTNWKQLQGTLSPILINSLEEAEFDNISQDNCVQLSQNEEKDRCEIVICANVDHCILITDRPRWEVIGNIQYLFTKTGKLLEEVDGSKIYEVNVDLSSKTFDTVTLRLPPSATSCWVYGIFMKRSDKVKTIPTQHFNMQNINSLLSESSQISSNAEKFKDLFDTFQKTGPLQAAFLPTSSSQSEDEGVQPANSNSEPVPQSSIPLLKMYIDTKFEELEDKLMKKISDMDMKQNKKLDQIIHLLEKESL